MPFVMRWFIRSNSIPVAEQTLSHLTKFSSECFLSSRYLRKQDKNLRERTNKVVWENGFCYFVVWENGFYYFVAYIRLSLCWTSKPYSLIGHSLSSFRLVKFRHLPWSLPVGGFAWDPLCLGSLGATDTRSPAAFSFPSALFSLLPFFSYLFFVEGFRFVLSGGLDWLELSVCAGPLSAGFPIASNFFSHWSPPWIFKLLGFWSKSVFWTPGGAG